jgi:hypothetical protein
MYNNTIFVLTYHRHRLLDLTCIEYYLHILLSTGSFLVLICHISRSCYICGRVTLESQKRTKTPVIKKAYEFKFGCKIGAQDKTLAVKLLLH